MTYRPATSTRWPSSSTGSRRVVRGLPWALALVCCLPALSLASAASLAVGSASLGAATAPLSACHTGELPLRYRLDGAARITHVTVLGVDQACAGGTIRLTLTNAAGAVIGSATATLPAVGFDGVVSLGIASMPAATAVARAHTAIDGR